MPEPTKPIKRMPRRANGAKSEQVKMNWPPELKKAAEARAEAEGYTFNAWMQQLVNEALEK